MTQRQSQWYGQAGAWLQVRLILNKLVHVHETEYVYDWLLTGRADNESGSTVGKLDVCVIDWPQVKLTLSMAVQLGCKREDETGYVHDWLTTGKSLHWVWQLNWDTSTWVKLDLCMIDCPQARLILSKAVQVEYKHVDDLASVWCEWAEMELRYEWVNCHAPTQNCCILHFSLSSLSSPPPQSLLLLSSTHCPHPCPPSQGQRIGAYWSVLL